MKIGLTGSIGTGKSTVSDILKKHGFKIIDADKIAREVMENSLCIDKIVEAFGNKVLDYRGNIDRVFLRNLVFSNEIYKNILEDITHPLINKMIWEEYDKVLEKETVIFDIPLLFESGYDKYMDKIIVVACDEDIQIARIIQRDKTNIENAMLIIKSQMPQEEKISRADYVIYNNEGLEDLEKAVNMVIRKF